MTREQFDRALEVDRACLAADERLWAKEYAKREAGFFVMGKTTSVAWCKTKEEAETVCRRLNWYGGTVHRVEAAKDLPDWPSPVGGADG